MDFTPKVEDSVHVSSSFETSATVFESTPKTETELTPSLYNSNPKKRKVSTDYLCLLHLFLFKFIYHSFIIVTGSLL